MSNSIYTPYTYLIGWSTLNKFYYGVRTAKNCNPNDFWVKYFTSSKEVKKFRKENGDPDIIQIRKTFKNKEDALMWESKVLKRMNIASRNNFLNLCNTFSDFNTTGYTTVRNLKTGKIEVVTCQEFEKNKGILYEHHLTGSILSEEHKKKISEANKGKINSEEHNRKISEVQKGKTFSDEHKRKISEAKKGKIFSDKTKNKLSIAKKGTILIHNLEKCLRIFPNELEHYIQLGYEMGMLPETKIKMNGYKKGNKPHNYRKFWIVNPNNETKFILSNEFENYSNQGFIKGRKYVN